MKKNGIDKAPAYQWYPKDYDSDEIVKLMSYEQQGIYRKLLDHQWLEGSIPFEVEHIAALLGLRGDDADRFASTVWPRIALKFHPRKNRLINRRMEREREKRMEFIHTQSLNGARGARKRWKKRR